MSRRIVHATESLERLCAAAKKLAHPAAFMEVCGTHTVNAFRCGLGSLTPPNVTLLSGPGCPVCVTSQGDIDRLIALADRPGVTLCTYGDMLRVPGVTGNLEQARGRGADVRIIYSATDAVKLAASQPSRPVVLAAVGFETTTPATAVAILSAQKLRLTNFSVLASHKRILPAMHALLQSAAVKVHGFLCPGHVSVIIGWRAYEPIVRMYHLPCVIAGFEDVQIVAALARLTELVAAAQPALENQYPQAVSAKGNAAAQRVIEQVFRPADVTWRGLGELPDSGLAIRDPFKAFDAAERYQLPASDSPEPAGCRCGEVITARCTPADCALFGRTCTPINPIGPCMVSSEGTCQAWFKYRRCAVEVR